jgi:hypothetical protein
VNKKFFLTSALVFFIGRGAHADGFMSQPGANEKSPSKQQVLWTETDLGYDLETEYGYASPAKIDFGSGRRGSMNENYLDIKQYTTLRALMAFLFHTGFEWQRMSFQPDDSLPIPDELDIINLYLATDFRWSEKDMLRLQIQPGFYTDMKSVSSDFNAPLAIAYTRIPSKKFQWALGLSINTQRQARYLPGGGFNYYYNDDWSFKMMLPTPHIEYKANDYLHLQVGADFRGDTYRVSKSFGDQHGNPQLNNALVSYQEIRMGAGFSWNVRPLIEINGEAGYIPNRSFTYAHTAFQAHTTGAPYVAISVKFLFQVVKDKRSISAQVRSMQYEFPQLQQFFKLP